ncbi:MAG: hypothetical protein HQM08_14265 [Candidatus Riflebacteria bacterium]|nr:hypothetical protein [Candidatus Riflebacteria bacterium]
MNRWGMSLIEVLVALFIMAGALGQIVWTLSYANRSTMDIYYKNLALALAREPLEIFKGKGFTWTKEYARHPCIPWFPLEPYKVKQEKNWVDYPSAVEDFYRDISIKEGKIGSRGYLKIEVQVFPSLGGKAMAFFSRKEGVSLETLLFEEVP